MQKDLRLYREPTEHEQNSSGVMRLICESNQNLTLAESWFMCCCTVCLFSFHPSDKKLSGETADTCAAI